MKTGEKTARIIIRAGSCGGTISPDPDGGVMAAFLYNMDSPTHCCSEGDVSRMRRYGTEKMARRQIAAWIKKENGNDPL